MWQRLRNQKDIMTTSDIAIIGAGIVGLATAYQLLRLRPHLKLTILEKESGPGRHQTGHNSGVVHSGIYYKPGSLKAKNCIAGRKELLAFLQEHNIPHRQIHKVIVAKEASELPRLEELFQRGMANGVENIELIAAARLREIEPHVAGLKAIYLPRCFIVDYRKVAEVLCQTIQQMGVNIVFQQTVNAWVPTTEGLLIRTQNEEYRTGQLINCGGLFSDRLAKNDSEISHQIFPLRGEYYTLSPQAQTLVQGLIYPVPDPRFPFLGVHLTPMMNGKVEAGPNAVLAWAREGYSKKDFSFRDLTEVLRYPGFWRMAVRYWKIGAYEMARSYSKRLFVKDLQKLIPCLRAQDLKEGGSGVRAQVVTREGKLLDDFAIQKQGPAIHVINAPSPAATASFAIGKTIAEMV